MFLIIEDDELGSVSTMMHEAAGGLELLSPAEPALSMFRGGKKKKKKKKKTLRAKSPAAFQKWKGSSCPKICVMTSDESPTESYSRIPLDCSSETFIQVDSGQNLAAAPADRAGTDPAINAVRPSSACYHSEFRELILLQSRSFFFIFWAP